MRLTTIVLFATLAVAAPSPSHAQTPGDPTGLGAARTLLRTSGAVDAMLAAMRANIPAQREALPQVPAEFWTAFESRMTKEAPVLVDSIAAIYAHKFTVRELQEITAFYNSPIGRKVVQNQASIITESSAIGQRWGSRIGEEVAKSLLK